MRAVEIPGVSEYQIASELGMKVHAMIWVLFAKMEAECFEGFPNLIEVSSLDNLERGAKGFFPVLLYRHQAAPSIASDDTTGDITIQLSIITLIINDLRIA